MHRMKVLTERSNLSMAVEEARRGPARINFFGNQAIIFSADRFLQMSATDLYQLQEELRQGLQREPVKPGMTHSMTMHPEPEHEDECTCVQCA